jgi:hypothetical protein
MDAFVCAVIAVLSSLMPTVSRARSDTFALSTLKLPCSPTKGLFRTDSRKLNTGFGNIEL